MENTKINWADHTFNPWQGCTKVSLGCKNCYAETRDKRWHGGIHWGKGAPRKLASAAMWKEPLKWNRAAEMCQCGTRKASVLHDCEFGGYAVDFHTKMRRARVFCASLADWLDDEVPIEWLVRLLALIHATPNLTWQLLTKRPENWTVRISRALDVLCSTNEPAYVWAAKWRHRKEVPANVWMGTTVEDQARAEDRIPQLLAIPARVRFLSCEPLLEAVKIDRIKKGGDVWLPFEDIGGYGRIDWVICGGESGPGARAMHPSWARGLRDQCAAAGVSYFFKQWGEWAPFDPKSDAWKEAKRKHDYLPWDGAHMARVGKHATGRLLDGVEHSAFPR